MLPKFSNGRFDYYICSAIPQLRVAPCKYMKNNSEDIQKFWDFVKNHAHDDVRELLISAHGKKFDFPMPQAICQIECRQKTARKLAKWLKHEQFLFPCTEVAEQCTHQCVAAYHAALIGGDKDILDITAGLGIDAMTLAEAGNLTYAIELDEERFRALRHNCIMFGNKVTVLNGDSIEFLKKAKDDVMFDVIFADPARRDATHKRLYFLRDCLPDVVSNYELLRQHGKCVMIKASPIIDITNVLKELPEIAQIHLVCINGECKEVLLVCEDAELQTITVVDLEDDAEAKVRVKSKFEMPINEKGNTSEIATEADFKEEVFLYDPNAGMHKLNCSEVICKRYDGMKKLGPNTELYVAPKLHKDFPGRIFKVEGIMSKQALKQCKGMRCEVAVRNYPLKAEELRKKLGVKSGGDRFIFGCKVGIKGTPTLLSCEKLKTDNISV